MIALQCNLVESLNPEACTLKGTTEPRSLYPERDNLVFFKSHDRDLPRCCSLNKWQAWQHTTMTCVYLACIAHIALSSMLALPKEQDEMKPQEAV